MPTVVAQRPGLVIFHKWTGTNDAEISQYLIDAGGPNGSSSFVNNGDGTATLTCPSGSYSVNTNDYINAESSQWASPVVKIYSPAEMNARYYPYPSLPPVE